MMSRHYILDADHRVVEVDLLTWAHWFETIGNRVVGYTDITSESHVSTVFMGIAHINWRRLDGRHPPMLFETMIFGGPLDQEQWRYSSWDDAEIGHKAAVRKARAAIGQRVTEMKEEC